MLAKNIRVKRRTVLSTKDEILRCLVLASFKLCCEFLFQGGSKVYSPDASPRLRRDKLSIPETLLDSQFASSKVDMLPLQT